jgi:hypothetical protein
MTLEKLSKSKIVRSILIGISVIVIALLIFQAGMSVGFHKASFSYKFGENYYKAFGKGERMIGGHGAVGKIIRISLPSIVIESPENIEKIILLGENSTTIRRFRDVIKAEDLKVDDHIVVIGAPNEDSQIEAKLIRIIPAPENFLK